jgi:hypothetical protein
MKKTLITVALLATAISTFAQGTITFGNNLGSTTFRAPIYGPELADQTREIHGQPIGTAPAFPAGTTTYSGAKLSGTGYTMALYAGNSADSLSLVTAVPFLTGASAGFITALPGLAIPNVKPGTTGFFEIRAWDNQGGQITSWSQVLANDGIARGSSGVLNPNVKLGGVGDDGSLNLVGNLTGWTSFNLHTVPEPSVIALGALGLGALLLRRRKQA